jgi:hypothetical protein
MKGKRCRKHCWINILVHQAFEVDTTPGALNVMFGHTCINDGVESPNMDVGFRIEKCLHCLKVRSPQ